MSTHHATGVLKELCDRTGIPLKQICEQAQVKYKTLHTQISHGRPIPFESLDRLAMAFDVPISVFSTRASRVSIRSTEGQDILKDRAARAYQQALRDAQLDMLADGYGLETDDILDWLTAEGNVLRNFDAFRENVDLFERVKGEDHMLKPVKCGKISLATRYFNVENESHFVRQVSGFQPQRIAAILNSHREASRMQYLVSDVEIDETIDGQRIHHTYRRVIAPVTDLQGNEFSLVFSRLIH